VQNTVGPVLDEKLEALRPKVREAQLRYREAQDRKKAFEKAGRAGDDPEKVANTYRHVVDELFDLRVLDPAMGSGHFLVEVVDYVTDKMLKFLNGFLWNPVVVELRHTRESIMGEMESQKVTIDPARLTDINLLKRHVLKRCVYGVDLNPMAVELAKLSLWLDSFTLGAPLSFLDHHLKCGNSLIGARVEEVRTTIEQGQMSLFGSNLWAGTLLATDLMRRVGELEDVTAAQVRESRTQYHQASDALAPFKRILDVYTSRWFGNEPVKDKGRQSGSDKALEFLRSAEGEAWLIQPEQTAKLSSEQKNVAQAAMFARESHRFFHWELEFPEVFFGPSAGAAQAITLKENAGFDVVVGNPPWGYDFPFEDRPYIKEKFLYVHMRTFESSCYFASRSQELLGKNDGLAVGLLLPNILFYQNEFAKFRRYFLTERLLKEVLNFGDGVFESVTAPCGIILVARSDTREQFDYIDLRNTAREMLPGRVDTRQYQRVSIHYAWAAAIEQAPVAIAPISLIREQVRPLSLDLGELCEDIASGISTGGDEAYFLPNSEAAKLESTLQRPSVVGGMINAYYVPENSGHKILYVTKKSPLSETPKTYQHLLKFREKLSRKRETRQGKLPWYSLHWPRYVELFTPPKIVLRQTSDTLIAAKDNIGYFVLNSVIVVRPSLPEHDFLCTILNSTLLRTIYRDITQEEGRVFAEVKPINLRSLPIRRISDTSPPDRRAALTEKGQQLYTRCVAEGSQEAMLGFVEERLSQEPEEADVVHDLLAYLAERMIELNKEKQAEQKRFLGWLEGALNIRPDKDGNKGIDSLMGKSKLQNYLGDYQKGERELPFGELVDVLYKVRGRLGASLSDGRTEARIREEYEGSLERLRPVKRQLALTDSLIDQVVYRLYGLTEEEIAVVEGKPG
jgi:hypothetical protein